MTERDPSVEYDSESGFYRVEIDPAETDSVVALIALLTEIETAEGVDTPPVYEVIDSGALDDLLSGHRRNARTRDLKLECTTSRFRLLVECTDGSVTMKMRPR